MTTDPYDATVMASDERERAQLVDETLVEVDTLPSSSSPASSSSSLERGAQLGRYIVIGRLGAGAMGVVFAAYDPELNRKVALKLLSQADDDAATLRLQREAQALAKLDHRNVVAVHDVGTHEDRLFVAMECIAGQDLRAWMGEVEAPRPWSEILPIFLAAGRGLAAAHGAGLIHRDFKPANVMLGDDGRVRVMDFGLARASHVGAPAVGFDPSALVSASSSGLSSASRPLGMRMTQEGAVLGTPAYMAPEQLSGGEVTTASDQFGFCVALFEALYGARPFHARSLAQLLEVIEAEQLQLPELAPRVPAWLHAVVVRGLVADPARRWPSMEALLDALTRDPALRRRRLLACAGLVALIGGAVWGVFTSAQARAQLCRGFERHLDGVWDAEARNETRASLEATGLSYAASTADRVEQALDAYTVRWLEARSDACEASAHGEQSEELLDRRMSCLDQRLVHVRTLVEVFSAADAEVLGRAAQVTSKLPALEPCADAEALLNKHPLPEDPAQAAAVRRLDASLAEVRALDDAGRYAEGSALADAVFDEATTLGYAPLEARAGIQRGRLYYATGKYEQSEDALRRAYALAVELQMVAEAAEVAEFMVEVFGQLARPEDARRWVQEHVRPWTRALGTESARAGYHSAAASAAMTANDFVEARAQYERALVIREQERGPEDPNVASILTNLGNANLLMGEFTRAAGQYERALAIWQQTLGPDHPVIGIVLGNLAIVRSELGEHERAIELLERVLVIREETLGSTHSAISNLLSNLAKMESLRGDNARARELYEQALDIEEQTLGAENPRLGKTLFSLGELARDRGELERARDHYARALAIWEHNALPERAYMPAVLTSLGDTMVELGDPVGALGLLERALALQLDGEQGREAEDPGRLANTRFALARALWAAPEPEGRDRVRADELAELARAYYLREGADAAPQLAKLDAWRANRSE